MAAPPRQQQLPRLLIPPNLNAQQPIMFGENAPLFSPGLPTSIAHGMHPPFLNTSNPLQTPMQANFFQHPPGAPGRPSMHRNAPSVAQLAAAGIFPSGMPMTPLGQSGFPAPMLGLTPFAQPFVPRNKRSGSISVGGPPKAVLGGPQRKVSPLPGGPAATAPAPTPKAKKVVVNLPRETVPGEGDEPSTRQPWARTPLPAPSHQEVVPPETHSAEPFPPDNWRYHLPDTVDVFLPGKQKIIEEKLEKLGVERGNGSAIPHIHAPHARAASISSPADPALLFFKLNRLQQSQNASSSNSLSTSPQPPLPSSTSPQLPPRFQGRHGHSMSLAQPPSFQSQSQSPVYNPAAAFNPFGPAATLGSDQIFTQFSPVPPAGSNANAAHNIHAPQGRVPANFATLAPPQPLSRPESRPDFLRGFGLDVTEEVEEPPEEPASTNDPGSDTATEHATQDDMSQMAEDGMSTVAQSRVHSRHVSHLSAALSLRSVGGVVVPARDPIGLGEIEVIDSGGSEDSEEDQEAVGEWTGSEDLRNGVDTSEDESIGEWSNPSDEERARQQRQQRRLLRRAKQHDLETPRRLPNFPRPPEIAATFVDQEDIVSNPSEEEHSEKPFAFTADHRGHFPRPSSSGHGRPLPPLPEAVRPGSAPYSYHDPALAHSREASEHYLQPGGLQPRPPLPLSGRTESLNPLAEPFVFGANRLSGSWASGASSQTAASAVTPPANTHTRAPSFGKPLSAAAPEFKPTGFTFRPPPGVPQLSFSSPSVARPLPTPPVPPQVLSPGKPVTREMQGREKRQRRGSEGSLDGEDEDGINDMSSFKFPPDNVRAVSAPVSPPRSSLGLMKDASLSITAKPYAYAGFSSTLPTVLQQTAPRSVHDLPYPPTMKLKRAPIPLDFKHPVSTNTVPAGLFKALVNGDGDDRTRRAVRSRLSSRDIFEHSTRPSLDDLNVPPISNRNSRNRLFTDPGFHESSPHREIFTPDLPMRRSSLPARHRGSESSMSDVSLPPVNLSRRIEMQQYEQRLEYLLDEKFEEIKGAMANSTQGGQTLSSSTEAMINEVVSLFRAQLHESAAKGLDDSQMDARGELDFEVIKDIIEQKHAENRAAIQMDIAQLMSNQNTEADLRMLADELTNRTVNAVVTATTQLAMRLQTMENPRVSADREVIVHDLMSNLMPQLAALRPEPIDYEFLTAQLTQAVKPHISQLIDLASDKRETAGLIVDKLVPILPSIHGPVPEFDTEAIIGRLTTEVRKIVAPLDAHEIKEQVSDLVVERLDSRLAVRDRAFSVDAINEKVSEGIRGLLAPIKELQTALGKLQETAPSRSVAADIDLSSIKEYIHSLLSDLPQGLLAATNALTTAQTEFKTHAERGGRDTPLARGLAQVEAAIRDVTREQQQLASQNQEFSDFCQDIIKHIDTLPEAMVEATTILQNAHADFSTRDTSRNDAEEIRRLMNTSAELQVQLAKARGAHGQVRVEKDMLAERLRAAESERDRLFSKMEDLQESVSSKSTEVVAAEAKNTELEEALARALERLKAADVQSQTDSQHIAQLEVVNRDLGIEKQQLRSQVDSLELRTTFMTRERDNIADELAAQRRQNEELVSQQNNWDDLRRASEQIQALTQLVGQADNEEIKELRRIRDRSKILEGEHLALQRRMKEYETKMMSNEKVTQTSRQSLVQAQQRAIEWEKRAKEYEAELETTRTKLDNAEQAHAQIETDYSLVKLQLEERDAEERLDKDRQNKLRDQIAALEAQVSRLQAETDQAKKAAATATVVQPTARYSNGNGHARSHVPSRPDSRASTIYGESRAGTPTAPYNGSRDAALRMAASPQPSVWSLHGSRRADTTSMTSKSQRPSYYRPQIPSPTPSNVSAAPTLGDDGWWE
ncbi:hypothetical protein IEO21_02714 [Rhodonia placenta]|uniref:Uncharacterized protein n=1 Tax=Rhodonia placenta TaxID=104341 RepID=A0A8H7U458_9APHY|nr:hypothetical protein IEO21_02714 [Postia placenta]